MSVFAEFLVSPVATTSSTTTWMLARKQATSHRHPTTSTTSVLVSGSWMRIHSLFCVRLEPEKRKHADSTNVASGVDADLSAGRGRRVIFKPTSGQTEFILDTLQKAKKDNYLALRVAASLGKLYFLLIT